MLQPSRCEVFPLFSAMKENQPTKRSPNSEIISNSMKPGVLPYLSEGHRTAPGTVGSQPRRELGVTMFHPFTHHKPCMTNPQNPQDLAKLGHARTSALTIVHYTGNQNCRVQYRGTIFCALKFHAG